MESIRLEGIGVKPTKDLFSIKRITKKDAEPLLLTFHYLKDISKGFKSGVNYGLFLDEKCVGVCIYTGFPVPELVYGMFGLRRTDQEGFFELSRLVLDPDVQGSVHNLASWFVSRTIRLLRKEEKVRAILSYADSGYHQGTVYSACNFSYYGLTETKKDFWFEKDDGSYEKHSRGKVKGLKGEWRKRNTKHRFVLVFDKKLVMKWKQPVALRP
jgi:hypothetical protein